MITNYPVEEFNSLLRQHRLNEEQLTLVKDIRRRGKNKVCVLTYSSLLTPCVVNITGC